MKNRYFPVFVPSEGKKVAVFGGGNIATRRVRTAQRAFGADRRGFCGDGGCAGHFCGTEGHGRRWESEPDCRLL